MDIFHKYYKAIKRNPENTELYDLALNCCTNILKFDVLYGMKCTSELKQLTKSVIKDEATTNECKKVLLLFIQKILIAETPFSLDSYFQALEFRRPVAQQFYLPRRKKLIKIVRALEKLLITDELDELFLSMPPRTGKTTLVLFAISWLLGMRPDLANLYCSFSGTNGQSFYKGVMEILDDPFTYCWHEIFPNVKFDNKTMCNSKETFLDTDRVKRYHSITCRSIDATLNGSCDCNGILIGDDLISGIEEAMNPARLTSVWSKVDNDLITRAKQNAKILWIGTRWSIKDPIGRRQSIIEEEVEYENRRVEIVNIPALNEKDESNFEYDYGVGFDTNYYKQRRASFESQGDIASWLAQYQGEPIEREGALFPSETLQFFEELPDQIPDKIFAPVDVAWGGGDACSCPCCFLYKNKNIKNKIDVYIPAVVFEFGDKNKSQPEIIDLIRNYSINWLRIEKNNGGEEYKEDIEKLVKENNLTCNIESRPAPNKVAKEARIFANAPDIKTNFHFLNPKKWNNHYRLFMQNITSYSIEGKNKNDDAPDSLSQANQMIKQPISTKPTIFHRPF